MLLAFEGFLGGLYVQAALGLASLVQGLSCSGRLVVGLPHPRILQRRLRLRVGLLTVQFLPLDSISLQDLVALVVDEADVWRVFAFLKVVHVVLEAFRLMIRATESHVVWCAFEWACHDMLVSMRLRLTLVIPVLVWQYLPSIGAQILVDIVPIRRLPRDALVRSKLQIRRVFIYNSKSWLVSVHVRRRILCQINLLIQVRVQLAPSVLQAQLFGPIVVGLEGLCLLLPVLIVALVRRCLATVLALFHLLGGLPEVTV